MKVQQVMSSPVKSCRVSDTLDCAAAILWDHDCGCVPVIDDSGKAVGMVTDRDICMAAYTQGKALRDIRVASAMSRQVWTCHPDDPIATAEHVFQARQVRRLPVIDGGGRVVGVLSLNDLARQAATERSKNRREVTDAEVGTVLAAIGVPRAPSREVATRSPMAPVAMAAADA